MDFDLYNKSSSVLIISDPMNLLSLPDETLDLFFDGTLQILQKRRGYRFSVDAVLLSQFIKIRKNEKAIDLGTGCGILPLLLSHTTRARSFVGVEIQKELATLARKNVTLNHLEKQVSILLQDFRELKETFPPGTFDVVFSNPPYRRYLAGRINPSMEKAVARHEIKGTLEDLVTIASYLLRAKGRCYLIYPASGAVDLLVILRSGNLEPKRLQFVHSRRGEAARFVLTESIKGSGVELKIMEPSILHGAHLPGLSAPGGRRHGCPVGQKYFDNDR